MGPLGRHGDQRTEAVRRGVAQVDLGRGNREGLQEVIHQRQGAGGIGDGRCLNGVGVDVAACDGGRSHCPQCQLDCFVAAQCVGEPAVTGMDRKHLEARAERALGIVVGDRHQELLERRSDRRIEVQARAAASDGTPERDAANFDDVLREHPARRVAEAGGDGVDAERRGRGHARSGRTTR